MNSCIKRPRSQSVSPSKLLENCIACSEKATDDVLECSWCEGRLHGACTKISTDQCSMLHNVTSNIVFFSDSCISKLPAALESYDNWTYFESCLSLLEKKMTELQTAE